MKAALRRARRSPQASPRRHLILHSLSHHNSTAHSTKIAVLEFTFLLLGLFRTTLLIAPLGFLIGSACALFLWGLDLVTATRFASPWLLYLLPAAGLLIGWLYRRFGRGLEQGANVVVAEIHSGSQPVAPRIAPLIFLTSLLTHLCGGSAGREGAALQIGGGIASAYARLLPRHHAPPRALLMAGLAGGFAGIFAAPLAGTLFALEVLALGSLTLSALTPCLLAAIAAYSATALWGFALPITPIAAPSAALLDLALLAKITLAALAFALAARLYTALTHGLQALLARLVPHPIWRPALGGLAIIALAALFGSDYLGLGVTSPDPTATTLTSSFTAGGASPAAWLLKILFTTVTLAAGFKGGRVTPLFFIGAALGNTLAVLLDAPVDLFAALGFVALFGAAMNTPLAAIALAAERFDAALGPHLIYFAFAVFVAYLFSGGRGVFLAQELGAPKSTDLGHLTGGTGFRAT